MNDWNIIKRDIIFETKTKAKLRPRFTPKQDQSQNQDQEPVKEFIYNIPKSSFCRPSTIKTQGIHRQRPMHMHRKYHKGGQLSEMRIMVTNLWDKIINMIS